jgi:hypothetical protein
MSDLGASGDGKYLSFLPSFVNFKLILFIELVESLYKV